MFEHMWLKIGFVFIDTYTCWIAFYLRQKERRKNGVFAPTTETQITT